MRVAAMRFGDLLDDRQAEADAVRPPRHEGLEETVDDLRRRSRPLVVNREAKLVADPPGGERDRCPYWRSLDRVQDEIVEGAPWLVRVVQRLSAIRLRAKGDTPCRGQSPRALLRIFHEPRQGYGRETRRRMLRRAEEALEQRFESVNLSDYRGQRVWVASARASNRWRRLLLRGGPRRRISRCRH